jgi:hypothetical protein
LAVRSVAVSATLFAQHLRGVHARHLGDGLGQQGAIGGIRCSTGPQVDGDLSCVHEPKSTGQNRAGFSS